MRQSRKALAASFVVTFAAGCDSKSAQPPMTPTVDVGNTPPNPPAPSTNPAAPSASAAAPSPSGSAVATTLPPAPSVGRVQRDPDGTCTWYPDRTPRVGTNGRVMPMNPPAPHQVQCPPGDGGT